MNRPATVEKFEGAQRYRMTADDYCRLVLAGGFGDAHVELVEGELIEMAPSEADHGCSNADVLIDLSMLYRPLGYLLATDVIVQISDDTVRSPDISVIDRDIGDRQRLLPADVLLAVEIANSTLAGDLGPKRIDYATAGIRHYWVVDLAGRRTHCFAEPQGSDYARVEVIAFGEPVPVPGTAETITVE